MFRIILSTLFLLLLINASAYSDERNVTPYGDYSRGCTFYGTCKDIMSTKAALNALNGYYYKKGYRVGAAVQKGRFIEADIYNKNNIQVDKVIFDRKTGRLRSIY